MSKVPQVFATPAAVCGDSNSYSMNAYSTQWSRHSCLQFNKLFDVIARRAA